VRRLHAAALAATLALTTLAGCDNVSANAGACGQAIQASAATVAVFSAAASGDNDKASSALEDVIRHAEGIAESSTGPVAEAGRDLAELARKVQAEGELSGSDALEGLKTAGKRLADLCRSGG
jgi:hypothetical protein